MVDRMFRARVWKECVQRVVWIRMFRGRVENGDKLGRAKGTLKRTMKSGKLS
jgi:hypothetical protein